MSVETYLRVPVPVEHDGPREPGASRRAEAPLEDLIHHKSKILSRKLDILSAEIWWRLYLSSRNLAAMDDDTARILTMLEALDRAARYHLREHQEKSGFYRKLLDLETERRTERVECWRDIVTVMRDFLAVWEAHEQTRARALFLDNVGRTTEGDL